MRRASRTPLQIASLAAALLVLLFVDRWPGFLSPGEWSNLQAAAALADRGAFDVAPEVAAWGLHDDLSRHAGKLYSNKPPGLAWIAAPAVKLVRLVLGKDVSLEVLLSSARAFTCLLPLLLFLPWLAAERERRGDPGEQAVLAAGALLAGTPALVYAHLFVAHLPAGIAAYVAAASLLDRRFARAGLFLGAAVLLQYPMLVVAVAFAAAAPSMAEPGRRLRALGGVCLGAAGPAAALLIYDAICFGGPFQLSTSHEWFPRYQALRKVGVAGISWPRLDALFGLLFSPSRGLFFFAPVLLLAPLGLALLLKSRARRAEGLLLLAGLALPVLVFSGFGDWHGGASFGPRYIVPVLPFAAAALSAVPLPAAGWRRAGAVGGLAGLALAGLCQAAIAMVSFPNVPFAVGDAGSNAIQNFCLPLLLGVGRSPTWLDALGLPELSLPAAAALAALVAAAWLWIAARAAGEGPRLRAAALGASAACAVVAFSVLSVIGTGENPSRVVLRQMYAKHLVGFDGKPLANRQRASAAHLTRSR